MLKKSNKISLEEATRLAILGKLPLMESKSTKKTESTTITATEDGLTVVESNEATVVVEPKNNCAECGIPETPVSDVPVEEPVEDIPVDEPTEEIPEEPFMEESKKIEEGEAPLFKKKINKTDIKKVENKEHKIEVTETRKRKKTETIEVTETTYIDTFDELRDFCWGSAANSTLDEVERLGKEEDLISWLEEVTGGTSGSTELNDIVAYDDSLEQDLGLFDYADEEDDEDEDLDESKKIEEGEAPLFKKKINKTDIKKVESKEDKIEEKSKKNVINKVDLNKTEGCNKNCKKEQSEDVKKFMENLNKRREARKLESKKIKQIVKKENKSNVNLKLAEALTKFLKESYKNGKEIKVEKIVNLTENKIYVKGSLVMENTTRDFSCKLVPIKEGNTFRKYTIKENKTLKITEGKTSKGKSFEVILRK